ncbi:hypothetical protein BDC45DRAFT_323798 [Circinella umbellata]|nr:hypothetical protein BDC45DRAFT_323798 [Circinella umbellata]
MTRSWTLEEVMMSKHILIIGINTNMFQYSLHSVNIPTTVDALSEMLLDFGKENGGKGSISQALSEAHLRTSTKPHDMIFALANTFSHVLEGMDITYDTDIQAAFNIFYRAIATKDLSILYFGIDHELFRPYVRNNTMGNYKLPSWSGATGYHPSRYATSTISSSLSYHINEDNMYMYVTTKCYWNISITRYKDIYTLYEKGIFQKLKECIKNYKSKGKWTSVIVTEKSIYLNSWADDINFNSKIYMTHYHQRSNDPLTRIRPLSLIEDCKECIVLPILLKVHIPFEAYGKPTRYIKDYKHAYFLPVIRKSSRSEVRYKAIGVYYIGEEIEPTTLLMKCWNHSVGKDDINSRKEPQEMLDILFENNYHDRPKEFIIE